MIANVVLPSPDLLDGMEKNKFTATERNGITSFLERAFVRLEAWFQWYNTTQKGIPFFYSYRFCTVLIYVRVLNRFKQLEVFYEC
jgi:hypothetical protein